MNAADDGSKAAYVRAIERLLARHGDGPFVFSPRDWARAADWFDRGVPLDLVRDALDDVEARHRGRSRVASRGLAAITAAVEESFETLLDGRLELDPAGFGRPDARPGDDPLASWRTCLEGAAPGSPLARLLAGLLEQGDREASPPEELDRRLDAGLVEAVPPELLETVEREVAAKLASFRDRMAAETFESTRRAAVVRRLRGSLGLRRP